MSAMFKNLAVETGTAVVVLSQLSRASDRENRRPKLSDLRDSGSIEQDADNVVLIHLDNTSDDIISQTELIVAKQRQGDTGIAIVGYHRPTMSYRAMLGG